MTEKEMTLRECIEGLRDDIICAEEDIGACPKCLVKQTAINILERLETIEVVDEPSLNFNSPLDDMQNTIYRQGQQSMLDRIREG